MYVGHRITLAILSKCIPIGQIDQGNTWIKDNYKNIIALKNIIKTALK